MSLAGERDSDQRNRIVEKDQKNGQDKAAGFAAFLRREAERDADKGKHDAGRGQRETAMVFDQVPAAGDGVGGLRGAKEVGEFDFTQRSGLVFLIILRRGNLERNVGGLESGDLY